MAERIECEGQKRDQVKQRKEKLKKLREQGFNYPNDKQPAHKASDIIENADYQACDKEELAEKNIQVSVAGRMMTRRLMGKASFFNIQDRSGKIQVYARSNDLQEGKYAEFTEYDLGDILYVEGHIFKTKVGELSIYASKIKLLSKSLHPLPDKFHGLADIEDCYRKRYIDIMVNEKSRERFKTRSRVIASLRDLLIPKATLITPNLPEAADLLGLSEASDRESMQVQASALLELGPRAVLLKGGHLETEDSPDLLVLDHQSTWFENERVQTANTHGTGCTLSSSLASYLGQGLSIPEAVLAAKTYINGAIAASDRLNVGHGHGPVHHFWDLWREDG